MGFFLLLLPFLLTSVSIGIPCTDAWGRMGHEMICKIAEKRLSPEARNAVNRLLPQSRLEKVCSWADGAEAKSRYPRSDSLHYVNTRDYLCNYDHHRDCPEGNCVVHAIKDYVSRLRTCADPKIECNSDDLKFLAHLMGDVHQPLHVGFSGDRGGNGIVVLWYGRKTKLHKVWDTDILEGALTYIYRDNAEAMMRSIEGRITEGDRGVRPAEEYASESVTLACHYAYLNVYPLVNLHDLYFQSGAYVVEKRIAQAGMRLAALLNQIFESQTYLNDSRILPIE